MKTHMTNGCGRGKVTTTEIRQVTCLICQDSDEYQSAKVAADALAYERFMAQTPRQFREPWKSGNIVCECGNDTFRMGNRTCYGHYENYVCARCGESQSRLTETGMSF